MNVVVQHVTFRSGRKVRKSTSSVTSVDKENVLPRTTARWHNEVINVPDILPASSPSSKPQRNIDIRYALTVSHLVQRSHFVLLLCYYLPAKHCVTRPIFAHRPKWSESNATDSENVVVFSVRRPLDLRLIDLLPSFSTSTRTQRWHV